MHNERCNRTLYQFHHLGSHPENEWIKRESRAIRELSRNCNTTIEARQNTIEPYRFEKVPV